MCVHIHSFSCRRRRRQRILANCECFFFFRFGFSSTPIFGLFFCSTNTPSTSEQTIFSHSFDVAVCLVHIWMLVCRVSCCVHSLLDFPSTSNQINVLIQLNGNAHTHGEYWRVYATATTNKTTRKSTHEYRAHIPADDYCYVFEMYHIEQSSEHGSASHRQDTHTHTRSVGRTLKCSSSWWSLTLMHSETCNIQSKWIMTRKQINKYELHGLVLLAHRSMLNEWIYAAHCSPIESVVADRRNRHCLKVLRPTLNIDVSTHSRPDCKSNANENRETRRKNESILCGWLIGFDGCVRGAGRTIGVRCSLPACGVFVHILYLRTRRCNSIIELYYGHWRRHRSRTKMKIV